MASINQKITPFLWFNDQAEQAAEFYTSVFKNSRVTRMTRYSRESAEASGRPEGTVMTVCFELEGQQFVALNGGPDFKFTEAVSFVVNCDTQEEIDYYWDRLSEGGDEQAQVCGWLKDKFGLSWQIVPSFIEELLSDPDTEKSRRAMRAVLRMKKIDIEALKTGA